MTAPAEINVGRALQRGDGPQQCPADALQHSAGRSSDSGCGISFSFVLGSAMPVYTMRQGSKPCILSDKCLRAWHALIPGIAGAHPCDCVSAHSTNLRVHAHSLADMCHALSRVMPTGQQLATISMSSHPDHTASLPCGAKSLISVSAGQSQTPFIPEHQATSSRRFVGVVMHPMPSSSSQQQGESFRISTWQARSGAGRARCDTTMPLQMAILATPS